MKIVLFNGPPRSGKDTAAKFIWNKSLYPVFDRMSMPIKKAFAATIGVNINAFGEVERYEAIKEQIVPVLGVSYRQWQIDFSESFMKPLYGEAIFAELFIDRMRGHRKDSLVLVPDCGFNVEYETLVDHYGTDNVLVIKIHRPGCTFDGDNRNYLKVDVNFTTAAECNYVGYITNIGTKDEFELKIAKRIEQWLSL